MPDPAPAGAFRRQPGVSRPDPSDEAESLRTSFGVPSGVRRVFEPTDGSTRVVLVRHGEAVCNVNGIVGGQRGCTGLTGLGRRQVTALAERLSHDRRARGGVRRSTPRRCPVPSRQRDCCSRSSGRATSTIVQDRQLSELFPGDADGLGWQEVVDRFGVPEWDTDPDMLIAPGGESWSGFVRPCLRCRARPGRATPGRAGGRRRACRRDRVHDDRQSGLSPGHLPEGVDAHRARLADRMGVGAPAEALDPPPLQRRLRDTDSLISRPSDQQA